MAPEVERRAPKARPVAKKAAMPVEVMIHAGKGFIVVSPETVTLYQGQELQWTCLSHEFVCEFRSASPFKDKKYGSTKGKSLVGPHLNNGPGANRITYKYSVTVPGVGKLDPTIEADPGVEHG